MTTMADFAALDSLLANAPEENPLKQTPTAYGQDAPINMKGPAIAPSSIGAPAPKKKAAAAPKKKADPNAIWDEAEVLDAGDVDDIDDGRAVPEYDIVFKQNVRPEDQFLGIDPLRHAGVSCSDALVLKVQLPDTKLKDIDLDVRPTFVRVSAPKFKLRAQLGERVDEKKGNAKWDADKCQLSVTLPIIHDFDQKMTVSKSDDLD